MTARLDVRDLTMTFGDVRALDGFSLSADGGKIYGLLGRNGSGKTTLLSIIAGFRKPTSGEVRVDGQPVFENPSVVREIALIREGGDTVEESEKVGEAIAVHVKGNNEHDQLYYTRIGGHWHRLPFDDLKSAYQRLGDVTRPQPSEVAETA